MALATHRRVGATALPKQVHLAGIELYKPERGSIVVVLPGAVGTHKADNLAGLHSECDITQRKTVASHGARYL